MSSVHCINDNEVPLLNLVLDDIEFQRSEIGFNTIHHYN